MPGGQGWASLVINPAGVAAFSGKLPDGVAFTHSSAVRADSTLAFNLPVYSAKARGLCQGELTFRTRPDSKLDGMLDWNKPLQPATTAGLYASGFGPGQVQLLGAVLPKFVKNTTRLNLTPAVAPAKNVNVTIEGGEVTGAPVTTAATYRADNKIAFDSTANPLGVKFTIDVSTGLVTGSFVPPVVAPAKPKTVKFTGALYLPHNEATGVFSGPLTTGKVTLSVIP